MYITPLLEHLSNCNSLILPLIQRTMYMLSNTVIVIKMDYKVSMNLVVLFLFKLLMRLRRPLKKK